MTRRACPGRAVGKLVERGVPGPDVQGNLDLRQTRAINHEPKAPITRPNAATVKHQVGREYQASAETGHVSSPSTCLTFPPQDMFYGWT